MPLEDEIKEEKRPKREAEVELKKNKLEFFTQTKAIVLSEITTRKKTEKEK